MLWPECSYLDGPLECPCLEASFSEQVEEGGLWPWSPKSIHLVFEGHDMRRKKGYEGGAGEGASCEGPSMQGVSTNR